MAAPHEPIACRFCGATMVRVPCGPVFLDRCDHCGGLWFDGGELEAVIAWPEGLPAHERIGSAPRPSDALVVCPRCTGIPLEPVRRGAVLVHRCPRCHGVLVSRAATDAILENAQEGKIGASFDFGLPKLGGSGDDEPNVVGAVLSFIGELLEPPG
jgi:Zn-finger nucleic acid-binding protein